MYLESSIRKCPGAIIGSAREKNTVNSPQDFFSRRDNENVFFSSTFNFGSFLW
jgi:hypothetical protein